MSGIDWGLLRQNVADFMLKNDTQAFGIIGRLTQMIIVLFISAITIKFGTLGIKKFFHNQKRFKYKFDDKRNDTLMTLCISVLRYSVYFIAIVTILKSVFGIDATTIVTAAGIGGLAIGFGAQSLVKDVITGFFILLEDQFSVGDIITIQGMNGTVEEMGLRITKLRHVEGDVYIIPNSEITKVTNHTRGNKAAIVDICISYDEKIDRVLKVLDDVAQNAEGNIENLIEKPKVLGINKFNDLGMVIRVFAHAEASQQWGVERELRKRIKEAFDEEQIKISYNKFPQDK